jgi:hypothetical protein
LCHLVDGGGELVEEVVDDRADSRLPGHLARSGLRIRIGADPHVSGAVRTSWLPCGERVPNVETKDGPAVVAAPHAIACGAAVLAQPTHKMLRLPAIGQAVAALVEHDTLDSTWHATDDTVFNATRLR